MNNTVNTPSNASVSGIGRSSLRKRLVLQSVGAAVIGLSIVAGLVYFLFGGENTPQRAREWQAVFLSNGQVYFGKIMKENKEEIYLTDIYYLQVSSPLQQDSQPTPRGELSLVKLGNELHGPEDLMIINKEHVLFTEDLRDDGKVVQAIQRYQKGEK